MTTNADLSMRARAALPGGVSHELRFRAPHPIFVERALGAEKWDVEGRRYIDFKMGSASQMLGHSHPDVVEALQRAISTAIFSADCHLGEVEWADWVNRLMPCAERTRFCASGSEATMLAIRLGRAFSGKPGVLRIDGHYHGWHDHALKGAKPGSDRPTSLGVPQAISDLITVCAANPQAMESALQDTQIGTVIIEASGANYGSVPLATDRLQALHDVARKAGVVLIFDEIITGFRWSPGGRQARDGIVPDLTTLAKIATGGLPGGAVCGKAEIMELMNNAESREGLSPPVSHKGTFNASPLIAAGANAAMEHLSTGAPQATADAMAARLREGITGLMARHGIAGTVYGESSTCHMYFGAEALDDLSPAQIRSVQPALVNGLRGGLLKRGVDLMSHTSCVTSAAHDAALIDEALEAFDSTFAALIKDGVIAA